MLLFVLLVLPFQACGREDARVLVVRRGWHIDIGFSATDLEQPLAETIKDFPTARYAFYGFGDRRYLTAKRHGISTTAAALWPGDGIVLLTAIGNEPAQAFGAQAVVELQVSAEQLVALQNFVRAAVASHGVGPQFLQPGPYEGSEYFASTRRYSAFHTCNTWIAEALQAAGLKVSSKHILFAGQLWPKVRKLAQLPSVALRAPAP
jgi:Protein of unknown function (DUF2459)